MSRIVLLILVLTISGSVKSKDSSEPDPVIMIRSTLKSWRKMYHTYQAEMHLGYCWADYFLDIKKIVEGLAAPRVPGEYVLGPERKNIFEDLREDQDDKNEDYDSNEDLRQEYESSENYEEQNVGESELAGKWSAVPQEESYDPAYQGSNYPVSLLATNSEQQQFLQAEQSSLQQQAHLPYGFPSARSLDSNDPEGKYQAGHRSNSSALGRLVGLGLSHAGSDGDAAGNRSAAEREDEESRELLRSRGFGNLILSMLGVDGPEYVESSVYRIQPNSFVLTMVRFFGTFLRVGREVMHTIDTTSVLACTKDYLWGKMLHWIDS